MMNTALRGNTIAGNRTSALSYKGFATLLLFSLVASFATSAIAEPVRIDVKPGDSLAAVAASFSFAASNGYQLDERDLP